MCAHKNTAAPLFLPFNVITYGAAEVNTNHFCRIVHTAHIYYSTETYTLTHRCMLYVRSESCITDTQQQPHTAQRFQSNRHNERNTKRRKTTNKFNTYLNWPKPIILVCVQHSLRFMDEFISTEKIYCNSIFYTSTHTHTRSKDNGLLHDGATRCGIRAGTVNRIRFWKRW